MTETETERIDNIVEDLTQSAAADALLGACSACSHPSCERKRQAERDTQIAGQELAAYIATLRAQLAGVREMVQSDALAMTYQTLWQYRKAVLAALEGAA